MWSISWAKKILKLYKALTHFEKQKQVEPLYSKAFKEFAKLIYKEVAADTGSNSIDKS